MNTPTPPPGYKLVKGIDIKDRVPEGAQNWSFADRRWSPSCFVSERLGEAWWNDFYAIPSSTPMQDVEAMEQSITDEAIVADPYQIHIGGVRCDPYRIARAYGINDPVIFQALKKLLRCGRKHKDRATDVREAITSLERWGGHEQGGPTMNKNYTLKELADIGAKAAANRLKGYSLQCTAEFYSYDQIEHIESREAFTKAVLDAIGYEFPKDEEREAFERWQTTVGWDLRDSTFEAWKAGREELRKESCSVKCGDAKPKEPAWIPWVGGECPLVDGVEFEIMLRGGGMSGKLFCASCHRWRHYYLPDDIVAYRVWE